jgi:tRNA (adenine22-N1)-methyltransferase
MSLGALNPRLLSVAELVRQGAVFADIGTDHAHLPIFLLGEGRIKRAVLSDINEGPLASARCNCNQAGLSDKVEFFLTDGAAVLCDLGITDIAICGMGGELIADIIANAPWLKNKELSLILQPMSKQAHLRRFLAENGFLIKDERYSSEGEKHYVALLVMYTGECREISDLESEIGSDFEEYVNKSAQIAYIKGKISAYDKAYEGKVRGENSADFEAEMLLNLKNALVILEQN